MGWEHKFFSDEASGEFLETHFPPEVKEAYDALTAGAFKADLFRYCVLFIYGGVYADVDVILQSKLDVAIDDDVGFMTPVDLSVSYWQEGNKEGRRTSPILLVSYRCNHFTFFFKKLTLLFFLYAIMHLHYSILSSK